VFPTNPEVNDESSLNSDLEPENSETALIDSFREFDLSLEGRPLSGPTFQTIHALDSPAMVKETATGERWALFYLPHGTTGCYFRSFRITARQPVSTVSIELFGWLSKERALDPLISVSSVPAPAPALLAHTSPAIPTSFDWH